MSSTENKRIKQRHGTYSDYQLSQNQNGILDDEFFIVDSGHPTEGSAAFYKPFGGTPKRLLNEGEHTPIGEGDVGTTELDDGAVTSAKLADDSVYTRHLVDGQVTENKLGGLSVSTGKIKNGAVNQDKLDDNCIGVNQLIDGQITENKLSTALARKINNKANANAVYSKTETDNTFSILVPTITNASNIANLKTGQLFIYSNNLARKTSNSFEYVTRMYITGGDISSFTPHFIGEFCFVNNKLYVGKNTSEGGFKEIELDNPSLKVKLTPTTGNLVADKTHEQIHEAMVDGRNVVVYYPVSTPSSCIYYQLQFSRQETVAQGTLYRVVIRDNYQETDYVAVGQASDYASFAVET